MEREAFEVTFAKLNSIPLQDVIACRCDKDYWDEAHLNTRGVQTAWKVWQAAILYMRTK